MELKLDAKLIVDYFGDNPTDERTTLVIRTGNNQFEAELFEIAGWDSVSTQLMNTARKMRSEAREKEVMNE